MTADFRIERSRALAPLFYRAPTPPGMTAREYQFAGVEEALNRENAIIGDAPGVGKSAQGVMISNAIGAKQTLVICPASLRLNWGREINLWSTKENVSVSIVSKATQGISFRHDYVVASYDALRNSYVVDAIMENRWDHVIYDEAHYLKDPKGNKRTRAICAPDMLPSVVGRTDLLTGTLMPNQPIECYNAMRLLDWSSIDYMSEDAFRNFYYGKGFGFVNARVAGTNKWEAKPSNQVRNQPRNLDDLQARLRRHLMIRRLKEDVLAELPAKQWHPFPLAMTSGIRDALSHPGWKRAEKLYGLNAGAFDAGVPIDGEISTARRLLGEAKADAVADYIEDLIKLEGKEKLIVTCWHRSVIDLLRDRFHKAKFQWVEMVSGMSDRAKESAKEQFQTDPRKTIILGQSMVMGLGHTLTAAQDVVMAEFDWVPGNNDQVLDRVHRMGQRGSYVLGHLPVVPGTLDERVLSTAIEKDQHIHAALDAR